MLAPGSSRIQQGARPTLSNFGTFMPRPVPQPATGASGTTVRSPRAPVTARGERPRRGHAEFSIHWPSAMTSGGGSEGSAQQRHPASNVMVSPRLSPRMPNTARADNRPAVTLGNIGSLLQRPQGQPQGSPRPSPREVRPQQSPLMATSPRLATCGAQGEPDTRSGVVYERDGFEVFYGLGGGVESELTTRAKPKLDGFDKFYGIRSHDKQPTTRETLAATEQAGGHASDAQGASIQSRELSGGTAGYPTPVVALQELGSVNLTTGARSPPRVAPPGPNVPTFSVSTPVPSYVPPVDSAVPNGVDVFSVATPMAPPPPVPTLRMS